MDDEKTQTTDPGDGQLRLTARQYVKVRRWRWERSAGFLYEMRIKFGADARKTAADWLPFWDAFWAQPVK